MSQRTSFRPQGALLSALAVASGGLVVVACSTSEDASAPFDADSGEADASSPDAARGDAGTDAAADVAVRTCSDENFCHTLLPSNETLRDVWGDGAIVWSVSEEGDVLRWDGETWSVHASKLGALYAVWGSGPTDIWIGGERGLFHGTGASSDAVFFEPAAAPGDAEIPIRSIWGRGPADVWAVGGFVDADLVAWGRVQHYGTAPGDGVSWVLDPLSSSPLVFTRVWGTASGETWIGGDDGTDYPQSGGVFRRAPSSDVFEHVAIDAYNPDDGSEYGLPAAFTGGGVGPDGEVLVIGKSVVASPGFWYGAPASGTITWSYGPRDLDDLPLRAVWGIGADELWAAGDYGRLRRWDGARWKQAAIMVAQFPVTEPLYAIWGTKPDDFWVVGQDIAMHRMPENQR